MKNKTAKTASKKPRKQKNETVSADELAFREMVFDLALAFGHFTEYSKFQTLSFDKEEFAKFCAEIAGMVAMIEFERMEVAGELE